MLENPFCLFSARYMMDPRMFQKMDLRNEVAQFENPEHTQQPQCTEYQQRLCSRQYNAQVRRDQRDQIDHSQETEYVTPWLTDTDETQDIFDCK